jgi:CheY-like chemotaxis protein
VLDGLGAMREIRKREKEQAYFSKRLPVIAVTANVRKEQIDTAITAGAVSTRSLLAVVLY